MICFSCHGKRITFSVASIAGLISYDNKVYTGQVQECKPFFPRVKQRGLSILVYMLGDYQISFRHAIYVSHCHGFLNQLSIIQQNFVGSFQQGSKQGCK